MSELWHADMFYAWFIYYTFVWPFCVLTSDHLYFEFWSSKCPTLTNLATCFLLFLLFAAMSIRIPHGQLFRFYFHLIETKSEIDIPCGTYVFIPIRWSKKIVPIDYSSNRVNKSVALHNPIATQIFGFSLEWFGCWSLCYKLTYYGFLTVCHSKTIEQLLGYNLHSNE